MNRRYIPALASSAAFHALALALLMGPAAAPRTGSAALRRNAVSAFIVAPSEDSRFPGLHPVDANRRDWTFETDHEPSDLSIGSFTFDIAAIADHGQVLFPFLTPGLSLEHFALAPHRDMHKGLADPFAPVRASSHDGGAAPALVLGDRALQSLIDKSWSRRDRWSPFQPIVKLADTHSPDAGKLPNLLQGYREQNWLQPYVDTSIRDPRLWAQLGLAAGHVNFVGFIRRYASEHPSTKATTELLFLLDKVAQASRDALVDVIDTDPKEDLAWTRATSKDAYNLIVAIRYYYAKQLARRGLVSREAMFAHYDKARVAILTGIVRATPNGYRASDARFLIGTIYWREGKRQAALDWWRQMTIDPTDSYVTAYSDILRAIRSADAQRGVDHQEIDQALVRHINRILDSEHGRWLMFSFDRLRQFGYRFDTF